MPSNQSNTTNPNESFRMSENGRKIMRHTESRIDRYYNDGGRHKGNCTYGYGTMVHRGVCTLDEYDRLVSPELIEYSFQKRLEEAEKGVRRNVKVKLSQAQFDALVSFTYNSGVKGAAKVFEALNKGNLKLAADTISSRIHSRQQTATGSKLVILHGLIDRRRYESAPFRHAEQGHTK
jgi:lysozyme